MYLLLLGLVLAVGPGQRLPEFALLDPQGKLVTPATMKKPAVIVFWASWCAVCKAEFPGLHRVAEETRVPFYVISREPKDTKEVVLAYMKAHPLFIPLLASDKDKPPEVANRFKVLGQPWTFVVDAGARWWPYSPGGPGGRPCWMPSSWPGRSCHSVARRFSP